MEKSVIIIGGGIGGLCTACLLGKEGYKVTVLERHYKIGGDLHEFVRSGVTYETGMHYISGFQEGGVLRKFFSYLGIFDRLKIKPLDCDAFDHIFVKEDHTDYPVGMGKERFIANWTAAFPEESEGIRAYTDAMFSIMERFPLCNMRISNGDTQKLFSDEGVIMPIGDFIARFIHNPKLRQLLAWVNPLYGGDRDTTPAYIHAIINSLYIQGASRFVGGSQQLADLMCEVIRAQGGTIVCNDGVISINVAEHQVQSVTTRRGLSYEGDIFISSLHPAMTVKLLSDPTQLTKAYRTRLLTLPNTHSVFVLFLKMKKNSFPCFNRNLYFVNHYDDIWRVVDYRPEEWPLGMMATTPPQNDGDEQWASSMIVSCPMLYDDVRAWQGTTHTTRPQAYLDFKADCERRIIEKLKYKFPDIEEHIDSSFSASPLTIEDYTGSVDGSLYGYVKDCNHLECSHLSPLTKIHNLYLAGQNINLHGILGVPLNSIITAGAVTGNINSIIEKISQFG
jgi:all-trans-retinol 13,14-reductase